MILIRLIHINLVLFKKIIYLLCCFQQLRPIYSLEGIVKLDENFYYDGVVRGNRPDGIGIMIEKKEMFSVRGRFSNTKLCGAGRVELETGEIYDGVFRNGIFCSGICYHSKEDRFIYGNFKTPDIKILLKGKGYPYQIFLNNKEKLYDSTLVYKTTCSEIIFSPQEDRHLIREFDRFKYNFDIQSSQSSYQDSIFINSDRQSNLSQIQEEFNSIPQNQQNYINDLSNDDNFKVIDQDTQNMIAQLKNSLQMYKQEKLNTEEDIQYQGSYEIQSSLNDRYPININKNRQINSQNSQDSITKVREQRNKEREESTNKSNILIESLKSKLEAYERIKQNQNQNQEQKQNSFQRQQNQFQSNDEQNYPQQERNYNEYQNCKDEIQNKSQNIPNNNSFDFDKQQQQNYQIYTPNKHQNDAINKYYAYKQNNLNTPDSQKNLHLKEDNYYNHQEQEINSGLLDSQNSQKSFATFSNSKKGIEQFNEESDNNQKYILGQDNNKNFKKQDTNEFMNIQINQSMDSLDKNQNYANQAFIQENTPKTGLSDYSIQSARLSPNKNEQQKFPSLQYPKYQRQHSNNDQQSQDFKDNKHITEHQNQIKLQNESIEFQRQIPNWEEESKDFDRNRQKSQFSVDFDNVNITTTKSNDQEMIENYFNNIRQQLNPQNIYNSSGTISALNEILSDQNYHSKGKGEDSSLMQMLDDRCGQNLRSLSLEKNNGIHRKFLDTSIQYLDSEQNINAKDSHNNSCQGNVNSFERSERKTLDKSNPSQFCRYTQNSLSERISEADEDETIKKKKVKGIEQIDENNNFYSSFNHKSENANDRAFINSNLNLTDGE